MRSNFKDITGQKFGKLTVLELVTKSGAVTHLWRCACDCGGETVAQGGALRGGKSKSCGCLQLQSATKHGMYGTPAYESWRQMKGRCLNEKHEAYPDYGGRGITVCDRWMDFANFYADMGAKPKRKSLDRIDNNGNYEPGNCRWTNFVTQNNNRRSSRFLTIDGKTKTVTEWIRKSGLPRHVVWNRLRTGWEPKDAISVPLVSGSPKTPRGSRIKRIHSSE